jgi:hypothetical protein
LIPAPHGSDDVVGIGSPDEWGGVVIGLGEEALDGGVEIDERAEHAALARRVVSLAKKPSTALSQEADFGV